MSEFQSAAIHDTVHEHPRPQGILWPEPPKEAKDTLPKDFGWPATKPATARRSKACSSATSASNIIPFCKAGPASGQPYKILISKRCDSLKERLNYVRTIPVYWIYLFSDHRELIDADLNAWTKQFQKCFPSTLVAMNYFLTNHKEFRNLLLHRLWNPSRSHKCKFHAFIMRRLWKPLDSLYLNTRYIGGGLFIQHGFSTIVAAKSVGKNCHINQQVTIGYKDENNPIIKDNVKILCGAKVLGNITMWNNSVAGANAVVVKDVPENAVVGGVPARIIKYVS